MENEFAKQDTQRALAARRRQAPARADYLTEIRARIGPEKIGRVVDALFSLAMAGDIGAARELLDRVIGRPRAPVAKVELRSDTVDELRIRVLAMMRSAPPSIQRVISGATSDSRVPECTQGLEQSDLASIPENGPADPRSAGQIGPPIAPQGPIGGGGHSPSTIPAKSETPRIGPPTSA